MIRGNLSNVLVSTAFAVIRSNNKYISNELIYFWITSQSTVEKLQHIAEMSKATYPSIIPDDILKTEVVVPNLASSAFLAFNDQLRKIYDFINRLNTEASVLQETLAMLQSKLSKIYEE